MSATAILSAPTGSFTLSRRPHRDRETLQAWDAADEYLLHHLAAKDIAADSRFLIVNDSQGALSTALADYSCTLWADSAISQLSSLENCARNERKPPLFVPATEIPPGSYDYILYKLPKSRSLLKYQLQHLAPLIAAPERFIAAAMARHIDHHVVTYFADYLAPARPSLARKKARLIELLEAPTPKVPADDSKVLSLPELGLTLCNRANVFSRDKLDRGSRLMLSGIELLPSATRVADLGCGNGLLGISAARRWPDASIYFFDDSFLAIDSACKNAASNTPTAAAKARYIADDGLSNYTDEPFDLILCNPPFHQDHHVGDHIAKTMFQDCVTHLAPEGRLCVVGNRHLGYHVLLKQLFGHCDIIASDPKFVVLLAYR
jgi:23S rRNA (guanine1835-N2)-methyltransferase